LSSLVLLVSESEPDSRGLVATLVIAIVGLGVEVVSWYRTDRAMQNAADSAAVAAATNGTGKSRGGSIRRC
jgi:Flp pilus assembly protein TadG